WSDFVTLCIDNSLQGLESLIGIPGTVGASSVQNIGAYGGQMADNFVFATVYNRQTQKVQILKKNNMEFAYRNSLLKKTHNQWHLSQYIILSVSFQLQKSSDAKIRDSQLAKALDCQINHKVKLKTIAEKLLEIRANKGTLIDPKQRLNGFNTFDKKIKYNYNRWSCGSFFVNPIVNNKLANSLPDLTPKYKTDKGYKLSAAWLIEAAGINKGFGLNKLARVSNLNSLALTNRGQAKSADIFKLANYIMDKVYKKFKVKLIPEVNIINLTK
ncbi:MAG: UDP-N-acetylenolpyruvoylglucosamine reductase, partial [Bifidobacteriaceae bacterium]|nr:UDP-N-acetylenolpyruvoylglucosamine reductase [Bifidobacteriaceae bacterium]